jgi:hypothetical protein
MIALLSMWMDSGALWSNSWLEKLRSYMQRWSTLAITNVTDHDIPEKKKGIC